MPLPAGHPPFSSFSSFHGVRAGKPLFYWLECRFVIFAIFVKSPLNFWQDKSTVYQKHRFRDPDLSAGKPMSIKFRVLGGGVLGEGGEGADFIFMGARIFLKVSHKGFVRAIDARNSAPRNGSNATKTSVRAPGLSADECEHPSV